LDKSEIRAEIKRLEDYLKTAKPHEVAMLNSRRDVLYAELGEKPFKNPFGEKDLSDFDFAKWREDFMKDLKK
jgi:hypothetical protein